MRAPARSPVRRNVATARVRTVRRGATSDRPDRVAAEEPMEIRAGGPGQEALSVAVTMRTPGNDFELAAGFLFTEGVVASRDEIVSVAYCDLPPHKQQYNVVTVRLARHLDGGALTRHFFASSSCGVCGKASLDQIHVRCSPVAAGPRIAASLVTSLSRKLREAQPIFDETGGLHATGLFDANGDLVAIREDVGRHNAVDKLVGRALLAGGLPLSGRILMVSGRVGFEIVQKAAVAGVPILCAVSAPSSLAVEAAWELGITLVGFVRGDSFNLYSHPERIDAGR